jgi:hypothetical protein
MRKNLKLVKLAQIRKEKEEIEEKRQDAEQKMLDSRSSAGH